MSTAWNMAFNDEYSRFGSHTLTTPCLFPPPPQGTVLRVNQPQAGAGCYATAVVQMTDHFQPNSRTKKLKVFGGRWRACVCEHMGVLGEDQPMEAQSRLHPTHHTNSSPHTIDWITFRWSFQWTS